MIKFILLAIAYFAVIPIILSISSYFRRNYLVSREKLKRLQEKIPVNKIYSRDIGFAFSYKKTKPLIMILFIVGLVITLVVTAINVWLAIPVTIVWPLIIWIVARSTAGKTRKERDKTIDRLLQIKLARIGATSKSRTNPDKDEEMKILQWDEDMINPTKIRFSIPPTFDSLFIDNFMVQFNDMFGGEKEWVEDLEDSEYPGWDLKNGFVTLTTTKPMPSIAEFHEDYILSERIAWSFFPLGLGSKGGVEMISPVTGETVMVIGFDVFGDQAKLGKKGGFFVDGCIMQSPQTLVAGVTGSGKSVLQRSIVAGCILRPEHWVMLAIDLKRVELSPLRKYGVSVATDVPTATAFLRFAANVMMKRYEEMEKIGVQKFQQMPNPGQAIMVMIDESAELFGEAPGKDEAAKDLNALKDECKGLVQSITQLGRAAGVYMIIASQRSNVDSVGGGTTRSNLTNRIGCGSLPQASSQMCFESSMGSRTPPNPKGRFLLKIHSRYAGMGQAFWINDDPYWFDEYFEKHPDRNPDVVHAKMQATEIEFDDIEVEETISEEEALADWDEDMEAIKAAKRKA